MARMAPAATAVVAATSSGETPRNSVYPTHAAMPEAIVIAIHTPNTYSAERPAFFMPAALDRPSGMLERKIAITATRLTAPPCSSLSPITEQAPQARLH